MSEPTGLRLEGGLGIVDAARQREQLMALLESQPGDLRLDLGQVEDFDSAGVQLLLATAHSLRERGHRLHLMEVPASVQQTLRTYGLDPQLARLPRADAGDH